MKTYLVRKPIITEKSVMQAQTQNVYLFEVHHRANKDQVKEIIQKMFDVTVESVRTVMQPVKIKRTGRKRVAVASVPKKKAFVKVKDGQKIDLFDIATE